MDKIIEKKKGFAAAFTKRALPYWMGAVVVVFVLCNMTFKINMCINIIGVTGITRC